MPERRDVRRRDMPSGGAAVRGRMLDRRRVSRAGVVHRYGELCDGRRKAVPRAVSNLRGLPRSCRGSCLPSSRTRRSLRLLAGTRASSARPPRCGTGCGGVRIERRLPQWSLPRGTLRGRLRERRGLRGDVDRLPHRDHAACRESDLDLRVVAGRIESERCLRRRLRLPLRLVLDHSWRRSALRRTLLFLARLRRCGACPRRGLGRLLESERAPSLLPGGSRFRRRRRWHGMLARRRVSLRILFRRGRCSLLHRSLLR